MGVDPMIGSLEGTGLYTAVLPFLLVFAVTYGLLTQIQLFGDKSRQVNTVIGAVIALYAVSTPEIRGLGPEFQSLYGSVGLLLIVGLTVVIAVALAGVTPHTHSRAFTAMGAVLAIAVLALVAQTSIPGILGVPVVPLEAPAVSGETLTTAAIIGTGVAGAAYTVR